MPAWKGGTAHRPFPTPISRKTFLPSSSLYGVEIKARQPALRVSTRPASWPYISWSAARMLLRLVPIHHAETRISWSHSFTRPRPHGPTLPLSPPLSRLVYQTQLFLEDQLPLLFSFDSRSASVPSSLTRHDGVHCTNARRLHSRNFISIALAPNSRELVSSCELVL